MINLWPFDGKSGKVKIVDVNDVETVGTVVLVWDAEEIESDEDMISVENKQGIFGFMQSQIKSIEWVTE